MINLQEENLDENVDHKWRLKLFHDGGLYDIETSPNQIKSMDWFQYDLGTSAMKERISMILNLKQTSFRRIN